MTDEAVPVPYANNTALPAPAAPAPVPKPTRPPITPTEGALVASAAVAIIAWAARQYGHAVIPDDIQGYLTIVIVWLGARLVERT